MISRILQGVFPGVPEGVPLAARLEDEVAGARLEHVVAEERPHAALEHVAVFVFAQVAMERRGERARRHRMLDEREAAVGRLAVDHEAHPDAAEEAGLPVSGPEDAGREAVCISHSFHWTVVSRQLYSR